MSVVLERPFTKSRAPQSGTPTALRRNTGVEQGYGATVEVAPQTSVRVRRQTSTKVLQAVLTKTALFAGVFTFTYVSSALYGNYMVDKSSKLSREALTRATAATQAKLDVQNRINDLTSDAAIQQWALSHAFRQTESTGQTSRENNLVTTNQ